MYPETRANLGRSSRPLVTRDEICDSAETRQAGPDPARVKRPGEGNVRRVECAALEWECSAIYAVASGFR